MSPSRYERRHCCSNHDVCSDISIDSDVELVLALNFRGSSLYAKECPELTPDVPRVEEKYKCHKQELCSPTRVRRGEIQLPSCELETEVNKDIEREWERGSSAQRSMVQY